MKKREGESALEEDEKGALLSYWNRRGVSKGLQTEAMFKMSLHEWLEIQKACGAEVHTSIPLVQIQYFFFTLLRLLRHHPSVQTFCKKILIFSLVSFC